MGVASHLGIKLTEYDSRIRSFIPDYEEMLDVAARSVPADAQTVIDLGIGTGALSYQCSRNAPKAKFVGVDADGEILKMAQQRLNSRATFVCGSFLRVSLPRCDAVVASFALHHVRTKPAKAALYARIHSALRSRGVIVTVDYHPAHEADLARRQMQAWADHLLKSYNREEARNLLAAWSREDCYMPLETEAGFMRQAGFRVEILWRRGGFAVLRGKC